MGHGSSFLAAGVLEHTLSEEEHSQIVQTIEMFEVITQTQPDDYQSLEILKEAYRKIGQARRVVADLAPAGRGLFQRRFLHARACRNAKSFCSRNRTRPDILAMLGEIETRLQASGQAIANAGAKTGLIATAPVASERMARR